MRSDHPFAKFVSLSVAVLMLVAAVACVLYRSALFAVPAAIISAYALSVYLDIFREELADNLRDDPSGRRDDADAR